MTPLMWIKRVTKKVISALLAPGMSFSLFFFEPLKRVLAYSYLSAKVKHRVDPSNVVLGFLEVRGTRNIQLGKNLLIYPGLYLETEGDGKIMIADNVVISRGVHIVAFSSVAIGEGTMIGEYSSIRDQNHKYGNDIKMRSAGYDTAPISIGANVWIGRGVAILSGVTIGDNAVVGANAVVSHDVPAGAVFAGVPAKAIK